MVQEKNRPFERPSLVNLNQGSKMYEESGSENDNIEENQKGENEKNTKELTYSNIHSYKRGKQTKQCKIEKPKNDHKIQRNQEKLGSFCHQGNDSFQFGKENFYR